MLKQKPTLPATTLVETMMALVILSISFGIGMMIYLNVINSNQQILKTKANSVLQSIAAATIEQGAYFDDLYAVEGLTIERKILDHSEVPDLIILHLTAMTPDRKKILERKDLIAL